MIAFIIEGEFSWGFTVRVPGTSAASPTFPIVPPSTLVGAFARAIANILSRRGISTSENVKLGNRIASFTVKILDAIKAATMRYLPDSNTLPIDYSDITRLERLPYIRKDHHSDLARWFGVSAFGKTYCPCTRFKIVYIIDVQKLSRNLGYELKAVDIQEALYTIPYLGTKESIVTIYYVRSANAIIENREETRTEYYLPQECVASLIGEFHILHLIDPVPEAYSFRTTRTPMELLKPYVIPARSLRPFIPSHLIVKINEKGVIYKVNDEYVVWLRR